MAAETTEIAPAEATPDLPPPPPAEAAPPPPPVPAGPSPEEIAAREQAAKTAKIQSLHRETRKYHEQQAQLKAQRDAMREEIEAAKAFKTRMDAIRHDPAALAAFLEKEVGERAYIDLTEHYTRDGKADPQKVIDRRLREMEENNKALQTRLDEFRKQAELAKQQQAVLEAKSEITTTIAQNRDKYPLIAAGDLHDEVFDVQMEVLRNGNESLDIPPGEWISVAQAAEVVERYHRRRVEAMAKAMGWAEAPKAPAAPAAPTNGKKPATAASSALAEAGKTPPRTLTNQAATSPATAADEDYIVDKDDAISHLLKKYRQT